MNEMSFKKLLLPEVPAILDEISFRTLVLDPSIGGFERNIVYVKSGRLSEYCEDKRF